MLNFHSFHQFKQKINVATNLIHRVTALTTDEPSQQSIKQIINKQLAVNNYPKTLVNRLINMYGKRPPINQPSFTDQPFVDYTPINIPATNIPPTDQATPPSSQSSTSQPIAIQAPTNNHQTTTQSSAVSSIHPKTNSSPPCRPSASSSPPSRPSASSSPTSQPSVSQVPTNHQTTNQASINLPISNLSLSRSSTSSSPKNQPIPTNNHQTTSQLSTSTNPGNHPSITSSSTKIQPPNSSRAPSNQPSPIQAISSHPTTRSSPKNGPQQQEIIYKSFLYVPGLTERISKALKQDYPQVKIAARQHNTVNKYHTKVKDPENKKDIHSIIYNMPCNNCNSCYIGMTQNKLSQRLSGHQSHVNKLETLIRSDANNFEIDDLKNKTAMIEHCITHEHRFNFDKTKIVDRSNNKQTLAFLEMCHIYNTPNTINKRTDVDNLNTAYAAILHTIKARSINARHTTSTMPNQNEPK